MRVAPRTAFLLALLSPAAAGGGSSTLASTARLESASGVCRPGARVVNRQGLEGVVLEATNGGADCRVKLDDGSTRFYLTWMLAMPGETVSTAPAGSGLEIGYYTCGAAPAGTRALEIRSDSEYSDRAGNAGTYTYDPSTAKLTFIAGPWAGNHGARLGASRIGISSTPEADPYAICNRE